MLTALTGLASPRPDYYRSTGTPRLDQNLCHTATGMRAAFEDGTQSQWREGTGLDLLMVVPARGGVAERQ